jgi:hypothetical protein
MRISEPKHRNDYAKVKKYQDFENQICFDLLIILYLLDEKYWQFI